MSGDPNLPGDSAAERDVTRRWREQSAEQPSPATDARIRAAAREALRTGAPAPPDVANRGRRWSRIVPLAAAASVALLAVGLVRLIPREEYQAIPATPEAAARRDAAPETAAPSAPAPAPVLPQVQTEIAEEPPPTTATDASGSAESRDELRAARKPAPVAVDEGQALEERGPQAERTAPPGGQGVPSYERSPGAAIRGPEPAAPPPPSTTITATSAWRGAAADADASALLPPQLARRVRDDAARRANRDPASIHIVAVDPVMWFDTSLGCEAGAFAAPEMRVPGYIVTVDAEDTELRYHTDDRERFRICDEE